MTDMLEEAYDADQITALEGLEAVAKRPGMYVGTTGKQGFHHLLWEVVDNSVDEAMGGYCTRIDVTLREDGSASVQDNGRGIPVEPQRKGAYKGMPTLEMVLTVLHAGGKFGTGAYAYSGGLHGVGISVVNALSEWVNVEVKRDGYKHTMGFATTDKRLEGETKTQYGAVVEGLKRGAKTKETGTYVRFLPNSKIFSVSEWDLELIKRRLRQTAFLNPGLECVLHDERTSEIEEITYCFPGGLVDFMEILANERLEESGHENQRELLLPPEPIKLGEEDQDSQGQWEMVMQWNPDTRYYVNSYVNGIETADHGTHVDGYQQVLTLLVNRYARQDHIGMLGDRDPNLEASDIRSGLGVVIAVKVKEPQFQGQTKGRLGNDETKTMVRQGFSEQFWNWMQEHPVEAKSILSKAIYEMRLRHKLASQAEAEREKEEKRGYQPKTQALPVKLSDCETKNRGDAELFIVEGDSAAGPAIMARDSHTQAVLPIRGKIINVERASNDQLSDNKEVQSLIATLGAGSEDHFDLASARYGKIVILTDADDDGRHIQTLLMTLFYRLMRPLVEQGHLYVARSPLFSTIINDEKVYAQTVEDRDSITAKHPKKDLVWTRFKGLGEMDSDELGETAIDPVTRHLARITISDTQAASETIDALMGSDASAKWAELQSVVVTNEEALV